jgi:hypothetical protein
MVPPASAADSSGPSKGGKPKGQFPGGWFEWGNPDGDGEYQINLTNSGAEPVSIPSLIRDGEAGPPLWASSLLVEHGRKSYTLPTEASPTAGKVCGGAIQPTVLAPGEAVKTIVNVLRLEEPEIHWPCGGSRVEFTFWLGELSCGPFSLYYKSDHHDVLRKNMGIQMENYQGVEAAPEPTPVSRRFLFITGYLPLRVNSGNSGVIGVSYRGLTGKLGEGAGCRRYLWQDPVAGACGHRRRGSCSDHQGGAPKFGAGGGFGRGRYGDYGLEGRPSACLCQRRRQSEWRAVLWLT